MKLRHNHRVLWPPRPIVNSTVGYDLVHPAPIPEEAVLQSVEHRAGGFVLLTDHGRCNLPCFDAQTYQHLDAELQACIGKPLHTVGDLEIPF